MEIALIAEDKKKELLNQLCIAYCGILSKQKICATGKTGKIVSEATGLQIECLLPGSHGGVQQITSRVSYDEVDVVIFFRDSSVDRVEMKYRMSCCVSAIYIISRSQQI